MILSELVERTASDASGTIGHLFLNLVEKAPPTSLPYPPIAMSLHSQYLINLHYLNLRNLLKSVATAYSS